MTVGEPGPHMWTDGPLAFTGLLTEQSLLAQAQNETIRLLFRESVALE